MPIPLPDYREAAQREAEVLRTNRQVALEAPLERILIDSPFVQRERLLAGLEEFHKERMQKIPSARLYPEAAPWVDYVLQLDRELQRLSGLTDPDMARYRSLHVYVMFRGFGHAAPSQTCAEKCRAAYIPESDHGPIHVKNVDDPKTYWKPEPRPTWLLPPREQQLLSDGVGNGMHLDDEPPEIFPLPLHLMSPHHATDVPSAVQFFTRYRYFWGGANRLFYDRQNRSVAIEKCSYNHIECFYPGPDGRSHISGMTCRDPHSPQGKYQRDQRRKYLRMFHRPDDCADNAFWGVCAQFEAKLDTALAAMGQPARLDDVVRLFTTPWPEGLNKMGLRIHPEQGLIGYTLITHLLLRDEGKLLRWQRSALPEFKYPDTPEVFEF